MNISFHIEKIAVAVALVIATSCSDDFGNGAGEFDEYVTFSVAPGNWQSITQSRSENKAADDPVHSRKNIEGTDYVLHTVIQNYDYMPDAVSRADESTLARLQESGFQVNAIVTEKSTGGKQAFMHETTVNHSGSAWYYSPLKYWPNIEQYSMEWYAFRRSDFTTVTYGEGDFLPTLTYTVPIDPTQQKDIITASSTESNRKTVTFNFEHRMTAVKIKGKNIDRPIIRIEFTGIYDNASFDITTHTWNNVGFSSANPNGEFKYNFVGSQLIGKSPGNTEAYVPDENGSEYYFMMLPQNLGAAGRNARVKVLFDNGTIITAPITQNWEAGKTVTYIFSYNEADCQWLEDANCYLINPISTSNKKDVNLFAIPISFRINSFWQNEGGEKPLQGGADYNYAVDVIWQDANKRVINFGPSGYSDATGSYNHFVATPKGTGDDEYVTFTLADPNFTGTANVLIGVRKANNWESSQGYLWTWHLWITDYYPIPDNVHELTGAARVNVPNGSIERYDEAYNVPEACWGNLKYKYLMDRNIGAKGPSYFDGSEASYNNSFGMYYQSGRKDPFPPNGQLYNIDGSEIPGANLTTTNADWITSKGLVTVNYDIPLLDTVKFPTQFVTYQYYDRGWKYDNWRNPSWYPKGNGDGKSFYDPCPPGWKLPNNRIFDIFFASQTFNSSDNESIIYYSPDSRAQAKEALTLNGNHIGVRYYINRAKTLTTDYLIWGVRDPKNGIQEYELNTLLWFKSSNIFQQFRNGSNEKIVNTFNSPNEVYGAQVRAIHE